MPRQLRVFLCHASQDKPAVRKMYAYLKQHGVQPWLDREDLLPGQDWEVEIPKAIFTSDVILVCLSSNSVNKEGYVQKEIVFALDKAMEKPQGTIFIIPVKLEECSVPSRLSRYQWVDYYRPDGRKRLLMGLNVRANDLGDEVSPVILEDTRRTRPTPKPAAAEVERPPIVEDEERKRAEREALERAEIEKAERERLAREAKEKTEREKIEQERLERAAIEKAERERLDREAAEKTEHKNASKQIMEESAAMRAVVRRRAPAPKWNARTLGIGGVVFACLLLAVFGGNYLFKNFNPAPTEDISVIFTSSATKTKTPVPTNTATPRPPTFTPTPGIGSTQVSEKDDMVMVYVPEGEFTMGSDTSDQTDERPQHQVYLDAFWIDQTEVTNGMFSKFVEETNYQTDAEKAGSSYVFDGSDWVQMEGADWMHPAGPQITILADNEPVIHVSWNDANAYCAWAGRELPTEAQWEKAARGTDGRTYPWGDTFDGTIVNFCDANCPFDWADKSYDDGYADVSPVGNYPSGKSIYGALDMAGNVWEWVSSLYQDYPYDASDGREDLSASDSRVVRGGSWSNDNDNVRSAYRNRSDPTYTVSGLGFRCSLSP